MELTVLRGLPGSGKSTYALRNYKDALICSADDYYTQNGIYKWIPRRNQEAHRACFDKFLKGIQSKAAQIVISNTNTKLWEFDKYVEMAMNSGYQVTILRFRCDVRTASRRNVHNVPLVKLIEMSQRFEDHGGELFI